MRNEEFYSGVLAYLPSTYIVHADDAHTFMVLTRDEKTSKDSPLTAGLRICIMTLQDNTRQGSAEEKDRTGTVINVRTL